MTVDMEEPHKVCRLTEEQQAAHGFLPLAGICPCVAGIAIYERSNAVDGHELMEAEGRDDLDDTPCFLAGVLFCSKQ